MQRVCCRSNEVFELSPEELHFLEKASPIYCGHKYLISPPTLCPEERLRRRLAFRNERFLYHRTCDLTGKKIISFYPPNSRYKVYDHHDWRSDAWDPMSYGREVDLSRSFFEQFAELLLAVPRMSLIQQGVNENSEYTNRTSNNKNCYLLFTSNFNEDCYYSTHVNNCRNCVDCYNTHRSELCYECVDCYDCYASAWLEGCYNCRDSRFLAQCVSCSDCLFCTNLTRGKYCIFNQQYSRDDYLRQAEGLNLSSHSGVEKLKERFEELRPQLIVKHCFGLHNENVSGNFLDQCRNTFSSFECRSVEDGWYLQAITEAKDCMDYSNWGRGCELVYETHSCGYGCYHMLFCNECWDSNAHLLYCDSCMHCEHLFGCVGLKHKQFCIMNRQYSRDDYEALVPRIIRTMEEQQEWGEFFPIELSSSSYNETVAHDYFPLSAEQVTRYGWRWQAEEELGSAAGESVSGLPDDVRSADEGLCTSTWSCLLSEKPYRMIKEELLYYQRLGIPLPRKCPLQRHRERMGKRPPRRLSKRRCAKTGREILTAYPPDRPEIVFSDEAYTAEFFS